MRNDMADVLVRTGSGTPMGKVMRRYWVPALLESEVAEPDGPPVRVQLLGERLLAFRDTAGRLRLVSEFCRHRGTSLFFGRNEERGIRCAYHGWKYDVTGQCIDLPADPDFAASVRTTAYPMIAQGGIVWAYMGPPELKPEPPALEWSVVPDTHRFVSKRIQECNYLQAMEGGIDTTHVSFVHRYELDADPLHQKAVSKKYIKANSNVVFEVKEAPGGLTIFGRRTGEPKSWYWRITQWIFPWFTLVPPTGPHPIGGHIWVPIDDENCWAWSINFYPHQPLSPEERQEMVAGKGIHVAYIPGTFRPIANRDNDYLIDRAAQKGASGVQRGAGPVDAGCVAAGEHGADPGPLHRDLGEDGPGDRAGAPHALHRGEHARGGGAPARPRSESQRVRAGSVLLDKGVDVENWAVNALIADSGNPLYSL